MAQLQSVPLKVLCEVANLKVPGVKLKPMWKKNAVGLLEAFEHDKEIFRCCFNEVTGICTIYLSDTMWEGQTEDVEDLFPEMMLRYGKEAADKGKGKGKKGKGKKGKETSKKFEDWHWRDKVILEEGINIVKWDEERPLLEEVDVDGPMDPTFTGGKGARWSDEPPEKRAKMQFDPNRTHSTPSFYDAYPFHFKFLKVNDPPPSGDFYQSPAAWAHVQNKINMELRTAEMNMTWW